MFLVYNLRHIRLVHSMNERTLGGKKSIGRQKLKCVKLIAFNVGCGIYAEVKRLTKGKRR